MQLAGKSFRAISNSKNGTISSETIMSFSSGDVVVPGEYSGGSIKLGNVIAKQVSENEFEMLYQAVTVNNEIQAGSAKASFDASPNGKLKMYLKWQWLTGELSKGTSEWEEV